MGLGGRQFSFSWPLGYLGCSPEKIHTQAGMVSELQLMGTGWHNLKSKVYYGMVLSWQGKCCGLIRQILTAKPNIHCTLFLGWTTCSRDTTGNGCLHPVLCMGFPNIIWLVADCWWIQQNFGSNPWRQCVCTSVSAWGSLTFISGLNRNFPWSIVAPHQDRRASPKLSWLVNSPPILPQSFLFVAESHTWPDTPLLSGVINITPPVFSMFLPLPLNWI